QFLFGIVGDVLAGDDHASGIRLQESHDVMQRDGLAHTAATQDADGLIWQNVEAYVIENDVIAEGFGDVAKFDVGSGHLCSISIASGSCCRQECHPERPGQFAFRPGFQSPGRRSSPWPRPIPADGDLLKALLTMSRSNRSNRLTAEQMR